MRGLEENFIDRALGEPGRGKPLARRPAAGRRRRPGRPGAGRRSPSACRGSRSHLSLRGRGGLAEKLLQRAGAYLRTVENLLEQPRYLMMAVMATFVVIL